MPAKLYDPNYHPKRVIELSKKGYSLTQCCADFNISKPGFWKWRQVHPEFEIAVEKGLAHAQAKAEKLLDKIAGGEKRGNVHALMFKMRSQFREDYQETTHVTTNNTLTIQGLPDEQLQKQIMSKIRLLSVKERNELLALQGSIIEGEAINTNVTNE